MVTTGCSKNRKKSILCSEMVVRYKLFVTSIGTDNNYGANRQLRLIAFGIVRRTRVTFIVGPLYERRDIVSTIFFHRTYIISYL